MNLKKIYLTLAVLLCIAGQVSCGSGSGSSSSSTSNTFNVTVSGS